MEKRGRLLCFDTSLSVADPTSNIDLIFDIVFVNLFIGVMSDFIGLCTV